MSQQPVVKITGLSKSYGNNPVVKQLDLEIHAGEIVSLLGPSGCGKTTTLRMVAGLERCDAGTIELMGKVVSGPGVFVPPEARGLGMVFQSHAVWPHMSVVQNVMYPLKLKNDPQAQEKARDALKKVGLMGFEDRSPTTLSGGQQQRVAIARALVARPPLLLLDEPLSALDARIRAELRDQLGQLARELGLTMILVTHDQDEALTLSHRVAVMNQGKIEQLSDPETLYHHPQTRFVASFVGNLNILDATATATHIELGGHPLEIPLPANQPPGPCQLGCRPEDIELGRTGIPCEILSKTFAGTHTRYQIKAANQTLRADLPTPFDPQKHPTPRMHIRGAWVLQSR